MRKQMLSLLFGILIITSFMIILMPIASADHDKKRRTVELGPEEDYKQEIDTSEGEVKYYWRITDLKNFTDETIFFRLLDDNRDAIDFQVGNISEYENKTELDSGEYVFQWKNRNHVGNISIFYNITFPVTGEGCYTTSIILSIPILGMAFCSIGINKKNK